MNAFFIAMMAFNAIGVLAIASLTMHERADQIHLPFKIGLLVLMLGLLGQFGRDAQCIIGQCPTNAAWPPLWALKDLGATIMVLSFLTNGLSSSRRVK